MSTSREKIVDSGSIIATAKRSLVPGAPGLPARRDDAKVFLREFTRELIREVSPAAKVLALLSVLVFAGGLFYAGRAVFTRYKGQQQQNLTQTEILTKRIDRQDGALLECLP